MERGVQRHHERVFAEKLGWPSGARVCVEPLRRSVNPRTKGIGLTAQGKYLVKTASCEGLWTEDRARSSGYLFRTVPAVSET
eukprot:3524909-Pyramimonas_sp.AAC.1